MAYQPPPNYQQPQTQFQPMHQQIIQTRKDFVKRLLIENVKFNFVEYFIL